MAHVVSTPARQRCRPQKTDTLDEQQVSYVSMDVEGRKRISKLEAASFGSFVIIFLIVQCHVSKRAYAEDIFYFKQFLPSYSLASTWPRMRDEHTVTTLYVTRSAT